METITQQNLNAVDTSPAKGAKPPVPVVSQTHLLSTNPHTSNMTTIHELDLNAGGDSPLVKKAKPPVPISVFSTMEMEVVVENTEEVVLQPVSPVELEAIAQQFSQEITQQRLEAIAATEQKVRDKQMRLTDALERLQRFDQQTDPTDRDTLRTRQQFTRAVEHSSKQYEKAVALHRDELDNNVVASLAFENKVESYEKFISTLMLKAANWTRDMSNSCEESEETARARRDIALRAIDTFRPNDPLPYGSVSNQTLQLYAEDRLSQTMSTFGPYEVRIVL